ncbi:hypothetical protein QZH41_005010 [Actinostola sp. cb2023]|nr:hypothetical protein QZH41_005010 [Actinostola sp. cb2023]
MIKTSPDGDVESTPHFRSMCFTTVNETELVKDYNQAVEKVKTIFLEYQREGSGWQLDKVLHLDLGVVAYKPVEGASYLPLPKKIKNKKAVLNVQNDDLKCFLWSVLAAKHPIDRRDQPHRVNHYKPYESELNMAGIDYPVKIDQVKKFERQNPTTSVSVFGFEEQELFPLYITKDKKELHVNLLLYSQDTRRHYCLIRDLDRLLSIITRHEHRMYHCNYCMHGFVRQDLLDDHEPHCGRHGPQKIKLPDEDHTTLQYTEVQKQLKVPFVIYADFESILIEHDKSELDRNKSFTQKTQHHQPCGFCYTIVSTVEDYCKPPVVYRGEDAVDKFLENLIEEEKQITEMLTVVVPMEITNEQEQAFQEATVCHICGFDLGADRVRDHDHLTGLYRGVAHNECNLNYKFTGNIPVVFHNLRGYDSHLIMQGLGKMTSEKISCIPNNTEKYISFSVGNLVFIDSLQFMDASLERLVANLSKDGDDQFTILKKYVESDKLNLLLRKGVYPYEYMNSFNKFQETQLPPKGAFYSSLKDSSITEDDYEHAQKVYREFRCQNLGEYHDLYLKSDVLLLADVFENFRTICLEYYQLDPGHFYTSPGLSWSACLKMTGVELELLTDPDMYLFIEEGLRGGISMITHRHAKANNPYVDGYDPEQHNNYLMYLDANNLYGWAMSQALPVNNFGWLTEQEATELQQDLMTLPDDGTEGYILEVDLSYPEELHDLHNDYPLAPERQKVTQDMLSPYCQQLNEELNLGSAPVAKLVPNLNDKQHYILHYRNLKQYLSLGMKLTKVHRVLGFDQSPWLKSYIDFNTEKRKHATNDFEKDFFKLMNNSVFGKTMENLRKRVSVKLLNTPKQLKKLTANPLFDYFRIFDENLVGVNMKKPSLYLNRPIYVGFCILDLSKTLMYDFHYNVIKQKYGNNATLLFTDTDSLCYNIKTEDIYEDMYEDLDLYDTSEYPRDHVLHSTVNKKVLGKMKDETHGLPIEEFVGLRPKMYSLLYHEEGREVEKKTAKGVAKHVTTHRIRHTHYRDCLFEKKNERWRI